NVESTITRSSRRSACTWEVAAAWVSLPARSRGWSEPPTHDIRTEQGAARRKRRPVRRPGRTGKTSPRKERGGPASKSSLQAQVASRRVEVAGIEPASFSATPWLLRVQYVVSSYSASALVRTHR